VGAEDNPLEVGQIHPEAGAAVKMCSGVGAEVDCWPVVAIPQAGYRQQEFRAVERAAAFRSFRRTLYLADCSRHNVGKSLYPLHVTLELPDEIQNRSRNALGASARFKHRGRNGECAANKLRGPVPFQQGRKFAQL